MERDVLAFNLGEGWRSIGNLIEHNLLRGDIASYPILHFLVQEGRLHRRGVEI